MVNLDGTVATRTDQRGVKLTFVYDPARRLAREEASVTSGTFATKGVDDSVLSIARTYTPLGEPELITSYQNANGTGTVRNQIKYSYDTYRNFSQIDQSHEGAVTTGTPFVSFAYDSNSNANVFLNGLHRTHTYYPAATNSLLVRYYGAADSISDRLHREVYEKLWGGDLNGDIRRSFFYEYNGVYRLAGINDDGNASFSPNLKRLMYSGAGNYDSYDRFGRTVKHRWRNYAGTTTHDEINCGYDYVGNRKWREDVKAADNGKQFDEFYNYDGLQRLKDFARGNLNGTYDGIVSSPPPVREQVWSLDQLGNWSTFTNKTDGTIDLAQTRYHNKVNEIDVDDIDTNTPGASITGTPNWGDPKYDAAGNMTTMPQPAAPISTDTLKYDAWNRLVQLNDPLNYSYEYDGLGQRIVKRPPNSSNYYHYYYNDQWQLLTETANSTVVAIYHWHPFYVDALATRMIATSTQFFLHDANFNVTAAVDDSTDAVVERYQYAPYGQVKFLTNTFLDDSDQFSDNGNRHLYTGRERDADTGVQINRNRYYASHLGRWLARDPLGYEAGDVNLYGYVGGMPSVSVDPFGLKCNCDYENFWKAEDEWVGNKKQQKLVDFSFTVKSGIDPHDCCLVNFVKGSYTNLKTGKPFNVKMFGKFVEYDFPRLRVDSPDIDAVFWSTPSNRWNYKFKGNNAFYAVDKPGPMGIGEKQDLDFKMCIFDCDDVPEKLPNSGSPEDAAKLLESAKECIDWSAKVTYRLDGTVTKP